MPDNVINATTGTLTPTGVYTPGHGTNFPGTASGISVLGSGTTLTGNIINNGTINTTGATGSQGAINIGGGEFNNPVQTSGAGAAVIGSITNSGTITSAVGINVEGNSSVLSTVTGSIVNAAGSLIQDTNVGIDVANATVGGSITNAGTISSAGSSAINVFDSNLGGAGTPGSGNIVNATGAHITGSANGFAAIVVNGSVGPVTTIAGSVINNGFISAFQLGIEVIEATALGVTNGGSGTINAAVGIALTGASHAPVSIGGNIVNQGTINAVAVPAFFSGGFSEGIAIFGGGASTAAVVGGAVGISNSGMISASGGKTSNIGIVLASAHLAGGITNSGAISASGGAHNVGIYVTSSSLNSAKSSIGGSIVNRGSITAGTGILVGSGSIVKGGIIDTGTINASADAINLTGEGAATAITIMGATAAITGNIVGDGLAAGDTLNFEPGSGNTFTYNSNFSAIEQVNVTSGTVVLNGTANNSSTLTVSGGTLMGTGIIATAMTVSGGAFAPGNGTPGSSMTITGSLAFLSGALYVVYLNPSTSSLASVTGSASLNGTVDANFASGSYVQKQYTILTTTGGLGGTKFANLTSIGLPPGFAASLSYNADDVFLNLAATMGLQQSGLTQNEMAVAATLDRYFNTVGSLPPSFANLFALTGVQLANALQQLDGENATGAERNAFELMNEFFDVMLDPYIYGRTGFSSGGQPLGFAPDQPDSLPPDIALSYAGVLKAPPEQTFEQRWTAWSSGFGGSGTTNGDPTAGSNNVTASTYGYAAGMDYHYSPDTVLGFALAGGGTNWNLAQGLGTGRSNAFLAGLYGVTHEGPIYLAGSVAFANNWFTTNRIALDDQLTANFQGQSYAARLEGGYRFAVPLGHGLAGVTPYAAIQTQNFHTPAYTETDLTAGGFGLSYEAMNGADTHSEFGARFDDPTLLGNMPLILRARAAWAHDWVSNPALDASFESLPGTSFTVNGAPIPRDSALTSAGAQLFFTPNWSLLAKFDGEFASGSQLYAGTGTLRFTW